MLFSIGIERPKDNCDSYSLIVPALCNDSYSCFTAADNEADISPMAKEVIQLLIETMQQDSYPLELIKDQGSLYYQAQPDYCHCDYWATLDIDLSTE